MERLPILLGDDAGLAQILRGQPIEIGVGEPAAWPLSGT
jgi:hypothetical protein